MNDDGRITRAELLAHAKDAGHDVSERQLAWWRSKGLVTGLERTTHGDRRGVWTYPSAAARQLELLAQMQRQGRQAPKDLAVGLLMAGIVPEAAAAQASLVGHLDDLEAGLRSQVSYSPLVSWAPPFAHAAAVARSPFLPRLWRMTLSERTQAFGLVVLLFLGEVDGLTPQEFAEGERCLERLMGLHLARKTVGGQEPWLTGHSLDRFSEVASLPVLRNAVSQADQVLLEQAVRSARRIRRMLPVAALVIEGWDPRRGRGGMEVLMDLNLGGTAGEALWLSFFLSIHQSDLASNLAEIEQALKPYDDIGPLISDLIGRPADLIRRRLGGLPDESRRMIERTLHLARTRST